MDVNLEWSVSEIEPGRPLPGLVEAPEGTDVSSFVRKHRSAIRRALLEHGALLFRGFEVTEPSHLEDFTRAADLPLMDYKRGMSPRTRLRGKIFSSTDTRSDFPIPLHTEMAYSPNYPEGVVFSCAIPAEEGGETPLIDLRKVIAGIPDSTIAELESRGLLYSQIAPLEPTAILTLTWPGMFDTEDRAEVERIAGELDNECEWLEDGSLRLLTRAPAFREHPKTGERVWFNQAPVYCGSLSEELSGMKQSQESTGLDASKALDCTYGDGGPLPVSVLEDVRRCLREESVSFPWQRGDVLLIDNLRVGHGRTPFKGERKVFAALAVELWRH